MRALGLLLALAVTQGEVTGPVQLKKQPAVSTNLEAMPRIVGGVTPEIATKINAALSRLDAKASAALTECRQLLKDSHLPENEEAWTRGVDVTMRGPGYLSLLAYDDTNCGGPHPNTSTMSFVYDLSTGRPVDWVKMLPHGASGHLEEGPDSNRIGTVVWPLLAAMERKDPDPGCEDAFPRGEAISFILWLDAKEGTIRAEPFDVRRVALPCVGAVQFTVAQARKMGGFNPGMLDALDAAHKLQK